MAVSEKDELKEYSRFFIFILKCKCLFKASVLGGEPGYSAPPPPKKNPTRRLSLVVGAVNKPLCETLCKSLHPS